MLLTCKAYDLEATIDTICLVVGDRQWDRLCAEPGRIAFPTAYSHPWSVRTSWVGYQWTKNSNSHPK